MDWKSMNKKQQQNLIRLGLLAILGVGLLLAGCGDSRQKLPNSNNRPQCKAAVLQLQMKMAAV